MTTSLRLVQSPPADATSAFDAASDQRGPVLVVEDDEDTRRLLVKSLTSHGFDAQDLGTGEALLEQLEAVRPSLVLLDVMLPGIDGLTALRRVREQSAIPVILVTGRDNESDRVLGLQLGADDYVVKPFSPRELAARVGAVLRRSTFTGPNDRLDLGDLVIDAGLRQVTVRGKAVVLTAREFDLLLFLARSPRRVFTRAQLLEAVWASHSSWQDESTVTEHVRRIRLKMEDDPRQPRWLQTVRGVGYCFAP